MRYKVLLAVTLFALGLAGAYAGATRFPLPPVPPRSLEVLNDIQQGRLKQLADHGTAMSPGLQSGNALQQEIAAAFQTQDLRPTQRMKHFTWLPHGRVKLTGWYGIIKSIEATPDGALVTVRIAPRLATNGGGYASTDDYCLEIWEYNNGRFKYIKGEKGPGAKAWLHEG